MGRRAHAVASSMPNVASAPESPPPAPAASQEHPWAGGFPGSSTAPPPPLPVPAPPSAVGGRHAPSTHAPPGQAVPFAAGGYLQSPTPLHVPGPRQIPGGGQVIDVPAQVPA